MSACRYIVGSIDFLIGVTIFLILTLLLSNHHFAYRAIRLPSTFFIFFGTAQFYSAWRGFCHQVWGRSSNQVKPWELDDVEDEETDLEGIPDVSYGQVNTCAPDDLFSPVPDGSIDIQLPQEVHALSDLSGSVDKRSSPLPWETPSLPILEGDSEMSEVARRQLAIRRATVKVPDASLAFPISESSAITPLALAPYISSPAKRPEISPFDTEADIDVKPDASDSSMPARTSAPLLRSPPQDLSSLLVRYRRTVPPEPQSKSTEPKIKIFGPEKLVEDPRIKRLYKSIVRDIMSIASVMSVVWVALCFAVPMRGLE